MKNILPTVVIVWLVFCPLLASGAEHSEESLFAHVLEQARTLATQPYAPVTAQLPQPLAELDYDHYRNLRFRPAHSLWRGEGLFEIQFFHLGFLYHEPVLIHIVEEGAVRRLLFDKEMFDYGQAGFQETIPIDLGFAGFRIHYPLHRPDYADEVAVFLGASYFRMVGRTQPYGISARGLAIDTALPSGEEFPAFREFWLVRPAPGATSMTIYALLDSKSVTGAYRFSLTPDTETVMDVQVTLFARAEVQRLGVAPLTSMFFTGENQARFVDDYRPEVHDSDGLLTHTGKNEWIWRPLSNQKKLHVSSLLDEAPRGFGLLQRDRNFDHYLDLEAHFERRPSFWVEPRGEPWGPGAVYLVEIPVKEEFHDNIVAFWVSNQPLKGGESRTFAYRLHASLAPTMNTEPLGYIARTRSSREAIAGPDTKEKPSRSLRRFMVDFAGGDLAMLEAVQPLKAELSVSAGEVSDLSVQRLPESAGWRVSFRLAPSGSDPIDMRLFLMLRDKRLTETWNYVWSPDETD